MQNAHDATVDAPSVRDTAEVSETSRIECFEPATRAPLGHVPVDDADAVRASVARARVAQRQWSQSSFEERRELLRHVMGHILDYADDLCEVVMRDSGKTRENAILGEVWPVCEKIRWTISNGEKYLVPESMPAGVFLHKRATVLYQPLGVIGVICPWNYPLQNVLGPTVPALFAGNAVVVKVSEQVAWSSARIQRIFDEAFDALGYPRDTVQIVNGFAETGAALVRSGVDKIVFTGSVPNGRRVLEGTVENITPVILELGGKDPFIVCEDAHVEQAVHAALAGVFISAGQSCMAAERVLVHDAVYDDFVAHVTQQVSALRQGSPLDGEVDVGAIVSSAQVEIIEGLVDDAVRRGARALVGGSSDLEHGRFFRPTVLVDVKKDMPIMTEELFGPVMVIVRVRDDDEAVAIANGTPFGLGSTVMSRSPERARRIAEQLRVGSCTVNDFGFTYMAQDLPFGGVDASGFGRLNGREGLRACTNQKAILEDRFPLHMPAKIYPANAQAYPLIRDAIRIFYQPTVRGRARAAASMVRGLIGRD